MKYFGFSISGSMFENNCVLSMKIIDCNDAKTLIQKWKLENDLVVCINPSHEATIKALENYDIVLEIPEVAPSCKLVSGDKLLLLQVSGLPRFNKTHHEYTEEELLLAKFTFQLWEVM